MKHLIIILTLLLLACKKEDPKPAEPTPPPPPITSANTTVTFKSKHNAFIRIVVGDIDTTLEWVSGVVTTTFIATDKKATTSVTFSDKLIKTHSSTVTVNSGHKSYTYIDTVDKSHLSYLW